MRIVNEVVTVFLYCTITFFAILLLAVVQYRSAGGAALDTMKLNFDMNRRQASELRANLESTENQQIENTKDLLGVKPCFRLFDTNGNWQRTLIDSVMEQQVKKDKQVGTPIDKLEGDRYCLARGFSWLQYDRDLYDMLGGEYSNKIKKLGDLLASNEEQCAELTKGQQDLKCTMDKPVNRAAFPFFSVPYEFVVILLVMTMGALGGVVRLLRDYGSSHISNPRSTDYFMIPAIGAVVAIGGYVLAKTGLLLLSSTKGETSLSPYMMSLVGIICGLLAKDVIDKIADSGHNILQRSVSGAMLDSDPTKVDVQAAAPKQGSSGPGGSTK